MKTLVEQQFSDFYEKWMAQLEELHQQLLQLSKDQPQESDCAAAINKLTTHHKDYYKFKWAAAHDDVVAFFSHPVWLTPFEVVHLWMTGWKPSAAFRLLKTAAGGVTEDQANRIEALRNRIRVEEGRVEMEMERLQVSVADTKTVELAKLQRRVKENGGPEAAAKVEGMVGAAVGGILTGLEKVMKMADCVRLKTLKVLLEILNPMQSIEFLASMSMFQIRVWKLGHKVETSKINDD